MTLGVGVVEGVHGCSDLTGGQAKRIMKVPIRRLQQNPAVEMASHCLRPGFFCKTAEKLSALCKTTDDGKTDE